jgi:hypothetical protein
MTRPAVGAVGFRVAPSGTQPVFVNSFKGTETSVSTPGQKGTWSIKPMLIPAADLFATRAEARDEYRRRRAA